MRVNSHVCMRRLALTLDVAVDASGVRGREKSACFCGHLIKTLSVTLPHQQYSIVDRLEQVDLLGMPTAHATALCILTAQWGHPMCGPVSARGFVSGLPPWGGMTSMEWKSPGLHYSY
jgi:hypothetical protein